MPRHPKILKRSFAGGEMSPEMFARHEDPRFQAGAETLLNCVPRPTGSVTRRPGTRMIRETRDPLQVSHLFSFIYSQGESNVIEAGRATIGGVDSGYFRFHSEGKTLLFPLAEHGFKPALLTADRDTFTPRQTVSCSASGTMVVTLNSHGLFHGDQVFFVSPARTLPDAGVSLGDNPDKPLVDTTYYVRNPTTNTFQLSLLTTGGTRVQADEHGGFSPVIVNYNRFSGKQFPQRGLLVPEHRVEHLEPLAMTMWPDGTSPRVTFTHVDGDHYLINPQLPGNGGYLPKRGVCNQQCLFAVIAGETGTLPPEIEQGRLYWVKGWSSGNGWNISETKNGARLAMSAVSTGDIRMVIGPEIDEAYGGAADGEGFQMAKRYYAVVYPTDPHILNLETSVGNAEASTAGLVFRSDAQGVGPWKVHRAYDKGDIATYADDAGGIRSFYCAKSWWEPDALDDRGLLTEEMHNGDGSRTPGSAFRTIADEGAYWRELPGRASGAPVPFTANDYVAIPIAQTFTTVSHAHGFVSGQAVAIVDGTAPSGFTVGQIRWAIVDSPTAIRFSTSYDGSLIPAQVILGPTNWEPRHGSLMLQAFAEFGEVTDSIRWRSHGLSNGDTVVFEVADGGTMQGGLTAGDVYYVREAGDHTFRVSATAAGALITFTGATGDLVTAIGDSVYEVPHNYSADELPRIGTTQSADVMTLASNDHPMLELRRISPTKWETVEPEFVAASPVPGACFEVEVLQGEGVKIHKTLEVADRFEFFTETDHQLAQATPVYVEGMPETGLGSLADGYYMVGSPSGLPGFEKVLWLNAVEDNSEVSHGGETTGLDGRVRFGSQGEDRSQTYRVTSVDTNNEESEPNESFEVLVNLNVNGALATIGWGASAGATRYRIYKKISGLFGLIGETDTLEFKDDNVGPDLAVAPPVPDESLRRKSLVTFDTVADSVAWEAHGLSANTPVVFETTDLMPGIEEGKTYYVLAPGEDEFQLTDDLDTGAVVDINGTDTGRHNAVAGDFPGTVTYFEGRRVFGGSRANPQDVWMTASGTESDLSYSIPTVDTDRIQFRIVSLLPSEIRHIIPLSQLVFMSDSTEYRLGTNNDDAVTPSSIAVHPQTFIGCNFSQPSLVNNTVVFAAARGGHMRELAYSRDVSSYLSGDLSLRAAHLFDGFTIVDQAYAKAPTPVVWCVSSNGKLLGLTYIPEEGIAAWHQHTTGADGFFESVTVVPEGDVDAVYVIVRRTFFAGTPSEVTKRFVERLADLQATVVLVDSYHVDSGLTYEGAATTTVGGLDHLEGEEVSYLADGLPGTKTVASGSITLDTAASTVHVGLAFVTDIKTLPLSMMNVEAFGSGNPKNITQIWVRLFQSGAFQAGPKASELSHSRTPDAGTVADGLVQVTIKGEWTDDGQVLVRQSQPLPMTVSGITIEVASGG